MDDLFFSAHAGQRMSQRGLSISDIELIRDHGTEVEGGFLMTEKSVRKAVLELKRKILRLEHLAGKRMVCDGDTVITAYHSRDSKIRHILRHSSERQMEINK